MSAPAGLKDKCTRGFGKFVAPEGLQAYQMLSEDVVRERGWINPRFPERATEVEEQN